MKLCDSTYRRAIPFIVEPRLNALQLGSQKRLHLSPTPNECQHAPRRGQRLYSATGPTAHLVCSRKRISRPAAQSSKQGANGSSKPRLA